MKLHQSMQAFRLSQRLWRSGSKCVLAASAAYACRLYYYVSLLPLLSLISLLIIINCHYYYCFPLGLLMSKRLPVGKVQGFLVPFQCIMLHATRTPPEMSPAPAQLAKAAALTSPMYSRAMRIRVDRPQLVQHHNLCLVDRTPKPAIPADRTPIFPGSVQRRAAKVYVELRPLLRNHRQVRVRLISTSRSSTGRRRLIGLKRPPPQLQREHLQPQYLPDR